MFKKSYTKEQRIVESSRVRQRYHDRLPCIVESYTKDKNISKPFKNKYLVPKDITLGQFTYTILKRLNDISTDSAEKKSIKAVFLFVDGTIQPTSKLMEEVYEEHKDEDGFLYFIYSYENTFG